jgi:hypothetical protein
MRIEWSRPPNHLHIVLRSRLDLVAQWSDVDVAKRWLRLFPVRRKLDGTPQTPTTAEIDMTVNQPEVLAKFQRFSDVNWWMRFTAEKIARRAIVKMNAPPDSPEHS